MEENNQMEELLNSGWSASSLSQLCYPLGQTLSSSSRNDRKLMKLSIVKQIVLVSTMGNVYREQYGELAYWCQDVKS